jgi:hypothetical protein
MKRSTVLLVFSMWGLASGLSLQIVIFINWFWFTTHPRDYPIGTTVVLEPSGLVILVETVMLAFGIVGSVALTYWLEKTLVVKKRGELEQTVLSV